MLREISSKICSATSAYSPAALPGAQPAAARSPSMVTVLPLPVCPYAKHVAWPPLVPNRWATIGRSAASKICAFVAAAPNTPSKRKVWLSIAFDRSTSVFGSWTISEAPTYMHTGKRGVRSGVR